MRAKFVVLALVVIAALLASLAAWNTQRTADPLRLDAPPPPRSAPADPEELAGAVRAADARVPAVDAAHDRELAAGFDEDGRDAELRAAEDEEPAPVVTVDVRGRVVDVLGAPIADVGVGLASESKSGRTRTRTAPDGTFALAGVDAPDALLVVDASWTTVAAGLVGSDAADAEQAGILVVATRSIEVAGTVIDVDGEALTGARIAVDVASDALGAITPGDLGRSRPRSWHATTDRDGRFRLERVPALAGTRLRATMEGCAPFERVLAQESAKDLWIELAPSDAALRIVKGLVELPDGRPAGGARVLCGTAQTRAAADGRFRLVVEADAGTEIGAGTPLVAVSRGFQAATIEGFGRDLLAAKSEPALVRLVLPGPALSIHGHVLDERGLPQKRVTIALADGTPIDPRAAGDASAPTIESLASGARRPVLTDRDGAFEIDGLGSRPYRIQATAPGSRVPVVSPPIEASARDVVITLPDDPGTRTIRGRVLSLGGRPLAGVDVVPHAHGKSATIAAAASLPPARTDADGRFVLADVARVELDLDLSGPAIVPARRRIDALDPGDDVELRTGERRRIALELDSAENAPDACSIADAGGHALALWTPDPETGRSSARAPLGSGTWEATVGEEARTLVLFRGGSEIGRRAIELRPDAVTRIRWR